VQRARPAAGHRPPRRAVPGPDQPPGQRRRGDGGGAHRQPLGADLRRTRRQLVEIAVEDSGPGIAATIAPRLFEPFVTSKPLGKGTGLGLARSREYVHSFGGTLELQPTPGASTRFAIVLPTSGAA
jgi:C4-dicarboxylate-specific signal transduction histidine kinase